MFGKLTWQAIPFGQPIPLAAGAFVVFGMCCRADLGRGARVISPICGANGSPASITSASASCTACWPPVMLLRGFIDALMMRSQQALAFHAAGYLPPEHYDQIFSAHGTIMIFFVAMPFVIGLMNFAVPLQLGVRDVAFPTLNSVSFWLTAAGALLVNVSLVVGEFARTGLAAVPAAVRAHLLTGSRCRLLPLGAADLRHRHADGRYQHGDDDPQDARARHELHAHADFLLDFARLQSADRRGLSDSDGDPGHAAARSLRRISLLHQRSGRQRDDVHEPDLGLGPPGGLHPDPACFRRVSPR